MLLKTKFSESNGVLSTDGRWLAYESDESGQTQVYLAPLPDLTLGKPAGVLQLIVVQHFDEEAEARLAHIATDGRAPVSPRRPSPEG